MTLCDTDHLTAVAHEHGTAISQHTFDVTDAAGVADGFSTISFAIRTSHPVRGLLACAGLSDRADALDYPADAFRRVLDLNVTGTFLCAQAAARIMRQQNVSGSIVLIASMSGTNVNRVRLKPPLLCSLPTTKPHREGSANMPKGVNTAAYNASKAALLQLARSLAAEWGGPGNDVLSASAASADAAGAAGDVAPLPPIRVNTLSPGYVRTAATGPTLAALPGVEALWEDGNMLGRLAGAHELRAPAVFLLSDGASFVTGADLRVDGGHCAW